MTTRRGVPGRLIFSFISGDPLCTTMVGYWYLVHLTKRLLAAGLVVYMHYTWLDNAHLVIDT